MLPLINLVLQELLNLLLVALNSLGLHRPSQRSHHTLAVIVLRVRGVWGSINSHALQSWWLGLNLSNTSPETSSGGEFRRRFAYMHVKLMLMKFNWSCTVVAVIPRHYRRNLGAPALVQPFSFCSNVERIHHRNSDLLECDLLESISTLANWSIFGSSVWSSTKAIVDGCYDMRDRVFITKGKHALVASTLNISSVGEQ